MFPVCSSFVKRFFQSLFPAILLAASRPHRAYFTGHSRRNSAGCGIIQINRGKQMKHLILLAGIAFSLAACSAEQAEEHAGEMSSEHGTEMSNEHTSEHGTADHAAIYAEHHGAEIAAAVAATDRPEADVDRDAARHPVEVLTFSQIEPGSTVLDIGAGGGYFTRLLANLMGPDGHVTGQNPQDWVDRFGGGWPPVHGQLIEDRGNADFIVAEFDNMGFAPGSLDAVTTMQVYHDAAIIHDDRTAMNAAIFDALRSGGLYLVSDHSALVGSGVETINSLHRIDEALVMEEVLAAGFTFEGELDLMRNAEDARDLNIYDPAIRGQTDRFTYLFRKP